MRIYATIYVILILTYLVNASVLDPVIENVVHLKASNPPSGVPGIWKKKTIWKPRWVKEWKSAKVMKPVWRKVWSPVEIREWVPIPKPPPGWDSTSTPLIPIHPKPQKPFKPVKDSVGRGSFTVHSAKVPLWDPVPYPESQQPPPLVFPQSLHNAHVSGDKGECDNSSSQTFNHQQISEIIGTKYRAPEYFQNPQYSETVNHLTRLPPDGTNWRPPRPFSDFQINNRLKNFQTLPEFLVPPKFQSLPPITNAPPIPIPGFDTQNGVRPWIPLPPENKIKGHFITTEADQPYKFQFPDLEVQSKNNATVQKDIFQNSENLVKENPQNDVRSKVHPQANGDFIQEAQLVGEYHYSEFDLPSIKLQSIASEKEQFKVKTQEGNMEKMQRSKTNQSVVNNKQKQSLIETKQPEVLSTQHVQKKHISNPTLASSNQFFQQEAVLKEIFPIYKTQQNLRPDPGSLRFAPPKNPLLSNHSSTKLQPVAPRPNSTVSNHQNQEKTPPNVNPIFIPPNHRFSSPLDIKSPTLDRSTTEESENKFKSENSSAENNSSRVQLVFATTPAAYQQSTESMQKSTTTEPYEIVFSSSLLATTEAMTRSPVIIVTPANSKENP